MIVAGHAPNFLPYIGFFLKAYRVDILILRDTVTYSKQGYHNRNRIRIFTPNYKRFIQSQIDNHWQWITVPIQSKTSRLTETIIATAPDGSPGTEYVCRLLEENYKNAPYFDLFFSDIRKIMFSGYEKLSQLNISLIRYLMSAFCINTKIEVESELIGPVHRKGNMGIYDYMQKVGGTKYLMGVGAHDHMHCFNLEPYGIKLLQHNFEHPIYNQYHGGFIKNMSAIDLLFNLGKLPDVIDDSIAPISLSELI